MCLFAHTVCGQVVEGALGGILFVDEAYSLVSDGRDAFGKEVGRPSPPQQLSYMAARQGGEMNAGGRWEDDEGCARFRGISTRHVRVGRE